MASPGGHEAQFYDELSFLAGRVGTFLADGLRDGGSAVAVARPEHLAAIGAALANGGIDASALAATGRLVLLDADATLAALSSGGQPDRAKFRAVIGDVLAAARSKSRGVVRVYGEMVDVLWGAGRAEATLELERLWNELATEQPFELLCGYRLGGFADGGHAAGEICAAHSHVSPSERFADSDLAPALRTTLVELELRAQRLETEVARRRTVERRLALLLELSSELAAAISREQVAAAIVERGLAAVGASYGGLWVLDDDRSHFSLLRVSPLPTGSAEAWTRFPVTTDAPLGVAVTTAAPVYIESLDEYRARFPASFERIQPTISKPRLAYAMLPLASSTAMLGALAVTFEDAAGIPASDRTFLEILARQSAHALERLRLLDVEQAQRRETELLYSLAAACNESGEPSTIYELALAAVEHGSRSDRSAVLLFDDGGVMRFAASHGLSETYRAAVEGHSPWTRDVRDPQPVLVDDTEADDAWAAYRPTFRAEGVRALAFVPLVHRGVLLGKFMLYRNEARPFRSTEIRLAQAIAAHVSQAVVRAKAYRAEREARLEADEATRAREEILSVVSHDLRNPLGAIMMGAGTLMHSIDADDSRLGRVHAAASRIQRQSERMARLIEDLVDFAGIQAGVLAIARTPQQPDSLIAQTRDLYFPLAAERGLLFEASADAALPPVSCDAERIVQIFGNLVTNAMKVTPRGGAIRIGARGEDQRIVFYVADTGPGIAPDELPSLFQRYWRSKHSQYKGAGLGLSIARGLVEAHGGRIWAESTLGSGSTFFFSLTATEN